MIANPDWFSETRAATTQLIHLYIVRKAVLARSDVIEVCDDSNPKTLEFQK
jgi:hypothetical protein